jgi:hypothetical protein
MRLLAILVGAERAPACLDAATSAARAMPDASVEALHVVVDPEKIIRASEEIEIQRTREAREGTANDRAKAIHAAFVAWNYVSSSSRYAPKATPLPSIECCGVETA